MSGLPACLAASLPRCLAADSLNQARKRLLLSSLWARALKAKANANANANANQQPQHCTMREGCANILCKCPSGPIIARNRSAMAVQRFGPLKRN